MYLAKSLLFTMMLFFVFAACNDSNTSDGDFDNEAETVVDGDSDNDDDLDLDSQDQDNQSEADKDQTEDTDSTIEQDKEDSVPDGDFTDEEIDEDLIIAHASDLYIIENDSNVLSVYAYWKTDIAAYSLLEVTCGDYYHEYFKDYSTTKTEHEFFVMGLLAETECTFTAHSTSHEESDNPVSKNYSVSALPQYLAILNVPTSKPDKIQPGWVLTNLGDNCGIYPSTLCVTAQSGDFTKKPLILAMVDEAGRYRWYYRHATSEPGGDVDVRAYKQGVLIGGGGINPAYITWEGDIVWTRPGYVHHHVAPYGEEDQFILLTYEGGCPAEFDNHNSDIINIWDRIQNKFVYRWKICEHYTPPVIEHDWSHMNAVEKFPDENAWIFSCRNQHALFKLDLDTNEIVWKLGMQGDFTMKDDFQFYKQHAPEILANGNILLFDNGHPDYRQYSKAIEIKYNTDNMTAEVVWSYRPDPDIKTYAYGDADRMPNGNTLMTFGWEEDTNFSYIIEVTKEKEKVFEFVTPKKWLSYRAEKVYNPPYGYPINQSKK